MLQHSVRPCQQWIERLEAMLSRAREDCGTLVRAFGEEVTCGEGGSHAKTEHAAQQLLAIAADFVAAAEKAERDNQRERGLAHVLGQLREVQHGLGANASGSPEAAPGPGARTEPRRPSPGHDPPPPPPPPPPLETPPLPAAAAAVPLADEPAPGAEPDSLLLQRARPPVARRVKSVAGRAGSSNENTDEPPPVVSSSSGESPGYSEEYF